VSARIFCVLAFSFLKAFHNGSNKQQSVSGEITHKIVFHFPDNIHHQDVIRIRVGFVQYMPPVYEKGTAGWSR
jgi:hypothetical protein